MSAIWFYDDIHFDPAVLMGVHEGIWANFAVHGITIAGTRDQGFADGDDMGDTECFQHCSITGMLPTYQYSSETRGVILTGYPGIGTAKSSRGSHRIFYLQTTLSP